MSQPTRRQFVTAAGGFTAATVLAPQSLALAQRGLRPLRRAGRFAEGVASTDPTTSAISLWTRLTDVERRGTVQLEVASDRSFRRVVTREQIVTGPEVGGAVKARVTGLDTRESYFYRFSTPDRQSAVGRFRTAPPAGSKEPVAFAFFSCQDFTHGFYNAHAHMAEQDLDFVVCLGDYIYAETYHSRAGGTGVRDDRIGREKRVVAEGAATSQRSAFSLSDYREKYALYRSDPNLRAVHAAFPMLTTWDDHELQNNYAGDAPGGGLPADEGYSAARRRAAYRAFFESNPTFAAAGGVRDRVHRGVRYGGVVDVFMMDQRQFRDDQPCNDAVAQPCADYDQPRDYLGRSQMRWLKDGLSRSRARWKIMGNELTVIPTKVLGGAFYGFDSWQGYPRERRELLQHIKDRDIGGVTFVTGDIHTFFAGDVRLDGPGPVAQDIGKGETVAFEFVGGSITSQNLGESNIDVGGGVVIRGNDANPNTPQALIDQLRAINPAIDQADFDHHGYGLVKATDRRLSCDLVRFETIKRRSTARLAPLRYVVERDTRTLVGQNS